MTDKDLEPHHKEVGTMASGSLSILIVVFGLLNYRRGCDENGRDLPDYNHHLRESTIDIELKDCTMRNERRKRILMIEA